MRAMRVGIVDVGANTVRLLVAVRGPRGIEVVREERVQVGLGEEIERGGSIGEKKLREAAEAAERRVARARKEGCELIRVLVTSPGRQSSNGDELTQALRRATRVPVQLLSAEEEGELAWHGAVAAAGDLPETVAVCDVGGGSTQVVVGTLSSGPVWSRSVDLGSLRLTRRTFTSDPPTSDELASAQAEVARCFADLAPPLPLAALATGGTARALRRLAGPELSEQELRAAVAHLARYTKREITKELGVDRARARTLTAGALILAEVQRRLGVSLGVARGGLREGGALLLLDGVAAATG
jgi:exopolyphosphatase / guanosine-5'-triphosphate,3'-diphosphate pyrophosphatase